jgi:hypothetical protein
MRVSGFELPRKAEITQVLMVKGFWLLQTLDFGRTSDSPVEEPLVFQVPPRKRLSRNVKEEPLFQMLCPLVLKVRLSIVTV